MASKNQIAVNLVTNVLAMSISMLISLALTPYLIRQLGFAAYGYIGLLNNLIAFMGVLTYTLNSMSGRFLAVSLERDGPDRASRYVSTTLFTNIYAGIPLLVLLAFLSLNLDRIAKIQTGFGIDVKVAFLLSGISLILGSICTVFHTAAYIGNRLEIYNGINILSNIARAVFIVSMFSLFSAHVWHYSLAFVLQVAISGTLGFISFRSLLPHVHFNIRMFNAGMSRELLTSGSLNALILLGSTFMVQIDLIVGNRYLPADIVGMYAAVLLIPNSIRNIAVALSSAFNPTTLRLYASGDMQTLRQYSSQVVKFCGFMLGWPVSVVTSLAIPILRIWLGKDYSDYRFTIILMLLPLTPNLAVRQLYNVQQAFNKVKIPALASIVFGVANLALAVTFVAVLDMGIFGIVLSGVIISTAHALIFLPIYTAAITGQPRYAYYRSIFPPIIVASIVCVIGILLQEYMAISTFLSILYSALALSILYMAITSAFLSNEERKIIIRKWLSILQAKTA